MRTGRTATPSGRGRWAACSPGQRRRRGPGRSRRLRDAAPGPRDGSAGRPCVLARRGSATSRRASGCGRSPGSGRQGPTGRDPRRAREDRQADRPRLRVARCRRSSRRPGGAALAAAPETAGPADEATPVTMPETAVSTDEVVSLAPPETAVSTDEGASLAPPETAGPMAMSRGARRRRSRIRAPTPSIRSAGRPAPETPRAGRRTCGRGTCGRIGPAPWSWRSTPVWTTGAAIHRRSGEGSVRRRRRSAHPAIPRCGCTDRGPCSSAGIRRTGRLRAAPSAGRPGCCPGSRDSPRGSSPRRATGAG